MTLLIRKYGHAFIYTYITVGVQTCDACVPWLLRCKEMKQAILGSFLISKTLEIIDPHPPMTGSLGSCHNQTSNWNKQKKCWRNNKKTERQLLHFLVFKQKKNSMSSLDDAISYDHSNCKKQKRKKNCFLVVPPGSRIEVGAMFQCSISHGLVGNVWSHHFIESIFICTILHIPWILISGLVIYQEIQPGNQSIKI